MYTLNMDLVYHTLFIAVVLVNCVHCQALNNTGCSEYVKGKLTASHYILPHEGKHGYLHRTGTPGGWCTHRSDRDWLEIDLGTEMSITAVATKGAKDENGRVQKYILAFSTDHTDWWDYMIDGELKIFNDSREGNNVEIKHELPVKVRAVFMRFKPIESRDDKTCLRVGVYGCKVGTPLGIEDGRIPNTSMWSTKPSLPGAEPHQARLHSNGGWCSNKTDKEAHLIVDLGEEVIIDSVVTQGVAFSYRHIAVACNHSEIVQRMTDQNNITTCFIRINGSWVKNYQIDYSVDKKRWKTIGSNGPTVFVGNMDSINIVKGRIFPSPTARYVAIKPTQFANNPCLRLELFGMKGCTREIGISNGRIPNNQMTASTTLSFSFKPWYARLNNPQKAWCSSASDSTPYIQIDLWITHKIHLIKTQGGAGNYVEEYRVKYSTDGDDWFTYQENNIDKVFVGNSDATQEKSNAFIPPIYGVFVRVIASKRTSSSACMRLELFGCPVISEQLGISSGEIKASQLKANQWHSFKDPSRVGLTNRFGWEASPNGKTLFFQVDFLDSRAIITGIATRTSPSAFYISKYTLRYSDQKIDWKTYTENGKPKLFEGNFPEYTSGIKRYNFRHNITTRYLMLVVEEVGDYRIGLRMELYGKKVCDSPLGMESGAIPNLSIQSTSNLPGNEPWKARLNFPGAWCAAITVNIAHDIKISLPQFYKITGIAFQGIANGTHSGYISQLILRYISVSNKWMWLLEGDIPKRIKPDLPTGDATWYQPLQNIVAKRFLIRIENYKTLPCMRFELYGCLADGECSSPIGLENHLIPSKSITASSSLGDQYLPTNGRVGTYIGYGAWCAATQNDQQFLQIDLEWMYKVTGLSTQGKYLLSIDNLGSAAVSAFKLGYSEYGVSYTSVTDSNGAVKIFSGNTLAKTKVKHILSKPFQGRYVRFRPHSWSNKICMRVELFGCKECFSPLGMTDGRIGSVDVLGNVWSTYYLPADGRFGHSTSYGTGHLNDFESFMEIRFLDIVTCVSAVAIEASYHGAVTAYTVSYSKDGAAWLDYLENGKFKVFDGPKDRLLVKVNVFSYILKLRHFKIHQKAIYVNRHMKVELFGCEVGVEAIGLKSKQLVPDSSFSATSSDTANNFYPYYARLNHSRAWCPVTNSANLLVNLGNLTNICRIDFRGNQIQKQWTSKTRIHSKYREQLAMVKDRRGSADIVINEDSTTTATVSFKFPIKATLIEFRPLSYNGRSCLRLEMYQCDACKEEIVISKLFSPTYGMTASTYFDRTFKPEYGSMRIGGPNMTWCAWENDANQYLQWDNVLDFKIVGITTFGSGLSPYEGDASWVTKYRVEYSSNRQDWSVYSENGQTKVFSGSSSYNIPVTHWLSHSFVARYVRLIPKEWHKWICLRMLLHGCEDRSSSLGLEQNRIGLKRGSGGHNPAESALHHSRGFRAINEVARAFFQIDIKLSGVIIYAVAMQGSYHYYELVWSYYLAYSPTGEQWINYIENGATRIFPGPRDRSDTIKVVLNRPITTRMVRVYPTRWRNIPAMSVELYGCDACDKPLGLSTGALPMNALTGSSFKAGYDISKGRMDSSGVWCSARTEVSVYCYYLQVDLGYQATVTGIQMMGDVANAKYITNIVISHADKKGFWTTDYTIGGNYHNALLSEIMFDKPFKTKVLRVGSHAYILEPCMKIEIIGCKDTHSSCSNPIGMETGLIKNESITATSTLGPAFHPWFGRLDTSMQGGGWCARVNNANQYIEVNLIEKYNVTRLMIQGVGTSWVDKYSLNYSHNGLAWTTYKEQENEIFNGPSNGNDMMVKTFPTPLTARYIRVLAKQWSHWICMRIEFGGCKVLADPLGLENKKIPDQNISGNSRVHHPRIRLYGADVWQATENSGLEFVVITLEPFEKVLTAIAMQGQQYFTTLYTIAFSRNNADWYDYIVDGKIKVFENIIDYNIATRNVLPRPIYLSRLKITPKQGYIYLQMKVELYGFDGHMDPYGVDSLPDSAFTASSFLAGNEPWRAKLNAAVGQHWCPTSSSLTEYIAIDLGMVYVISAIGLEEGGSNYVFTFNLFSKDNENDSWQPYSEFSPTGTEPVGFKGVNCRTPRRLINMKHKLETRHVKILPVEKIGKPCLRVEFYGCKGCLSDLGIGSYEINDDALTASGYLNPHTSPYMARLHSIRGLGAWCAAANENEPYLQIDFYWARRLNKIAIQGRKDEKAWVKSFTLSYREDYKDWQTYTEGNLVKEFVANVDGNSVVTQTLHIPSARYLRILPKTWHSMACMRMEVYGCTTKEEINKGVALGMQNYKIRNIDIIGTSYINGKLPTMARLFHVYGWYSGITTPSYLLVDLGLTKNIVTRVATQGHGLYVESVIAYYLAFSRDGLLFHRYFEHKRPKVFHGSMINERWSVVQHRLRSDIVTRYVKFEIAQLFMGIGMRVEIYGRRVLPTSFMSSSNTNTSVGYHVTSTGNVTSPQVHGSTPVSYHISWCSEFNDDYTFMTIKFTTDVKVSNVSIKTENPNGFFLYYSPSGQGYRILTESGVNKVLHNGITELKTSVATKRIKLKPAGRDVSLCVKVDVFGYDLSSPLLQQNQPVRHNITASSHKYPFSPELGVITLDNVYQGWCTDKFDSDPFLKVDFYFPYVLGFIATQGIHTTGLEAWVSNYTVEYSTDDVDWRWHSTKGEETVKVFDGNTNAHLVVKHPIDPAIIARYVKIHPVTWQGRLVCLRADLYGYSEYVDLLGMNTFAISDSAINASSYISKSLPYLARLNRAFTDGVWKADLSYDNHHIEVDLGERFLIKGISTQGDLYEKMFVTSYKLMYCLEDGTWTTFNENGTIKVFNGSVDNSEVVTNYLKQGFVSRLVRINLISWHVQPAFRFELLGHKVPVIDGGYTTFTNWTTCNATCGGGVQSRSRNCTNPAPSYGGMNCTGKAEEIRGCNILLCPAPNVTTAKAIVPTNQLTNFTINNCNQSQEKTVDFGDQTALLSTNECTFQHNYTKPGIYEIKVSIPRHHDGLVSIYTEDKLEGFRVISRANATLTSKYFFVNWTLTQGTLPHIEINFNDGTEINKFTIANIKSNYLRSDTHQFTIAGVYNVTIIAYNHVSKMEVTTDTIIEEYIDIHNATVSNLGVFDRYYQMEEIAINVTLQGSTPHYRYHMGNGVIFNNFVPYVSYKYPQPGTYDITIEVYNNATSMNVTKTIVVNPVIPFNDNAKASANATSYLTPTLVHFDLDVAYPYECIFDFSDGNSTRVLSTHNMSVVPNIFASIGSYDITISCTNSLSSKILSVNVIVQKSITDLEFVNDSPKEMNETVTHKVTAAEWGTDSCYYMTLGDGSSLGFGKAHCNSKYPGVAFKEINNATYIVQNMYYEVKLFFDSLHAWNLVSEFKIENRVPILKMSCNYPNTTIMELSADFTAPTKIKRSTAVRLETITTVNCRATTIKDYTWNYFKVSTTKTQVGADQSVGTKDSAYILPKTLDYGLYLIRFNVSMRDQMGVWTTADAFVDVVPEDLNVVINGGQIIERGYGTMANFDGSLSYDPDYPGISDLGYYWYITNDTSIEELDIKAVTLGQPIEQSTAFNEDVFCDMSSPRRLFKGGTKISLMTSKLQLNETYEIFLVVTRTIAGVSRRNATSQLLAVVEGDPPIVSASCLANCLAKVILTDKYTISGSCEEESPDTPVAYSWDLSILEGSPTKRKRRALQSQYWKRIENLRNMTSTDLDNKNIVIKPNTLVGGRRYRLTMSAKIYGRRKGRAVMEMIVNLPPQGGECTVDIPSGIADFTNFAFDCHGWQDDDTPLSYEHNYRNGYGLMTMIYYGLRNKITSTLPVGDPEKDFMIVFVVRVFDSYRAYVEYQFPVQVKLPSGSSENLLKDLMSTLTSDDGEAFKLLEEGKIQEYTQEVNAKMSIVNLLSEGSTDEDSRNNRQQMRNKLVKSLYSIPVDSIQAINQIGPTIAAISAVKEEVPVETQKMILKGCGDMANVLDSKMKEPAGIGTTAMVEASTTLAFCFGNLMSAAGDSAKVFGSVSPKESGNDEQETRNTGKKLAKQANEIVQNMTKSLLDFKVPGEEPTVVNTPSMSFVLAREYPSQMGNKSMGDGKAKVGMPSADEMFGDKMKNLSFVDAQFLRFEDNPMTWDDSAENITSNMVSLKIKTENSSEIKVAGVPTPFDLYIPRVPPKGAPFTNRTFLKKKVDSVAYHRFNWTTEELPLFMIVKPNSTKAVFEIYIKEKERPNVKKDPLYLTLPDFSSCKVDALGKKNCEPYAIPINDTIVKTSGIYYLGLKLKSIGEESESRKRRDCGTGKREKRSCLQYKDPPVRPLTLPPGVSGGSLVDSVPTFDPDNDLAYGIKTIGSPCKFWDTKREKWSSEGCKTGKFTRLDVVHCQCNHLTEFGGDLLVAPNPIDFDQVFAGFANISDNLSVLLTICTALALYILIGIWVRKKDKQDLLKGGVTLIEAENSRYLGANSNEYLVTVQTGSWKNSATTAKVFMNIIGLKGQSGKVSLVDDTKQLFARGATNEFKLTLPKSLGSLQYLRVWHDMSGEDSSWYMSYVIIRDLNSNEQWIFVCDRWLALDKDDGLVDRLIIVSGDKELKSFKTLFRTKTSQDLFDGHLWLSVIGKPPKSNFTRLQRLSCCMSLLFTTMMTSAMFFNIPSGEATQDDSIVIGPLRFSIRQLMIGIQSSFIALPVNVIIIQIFRNARPKPDKNEEKKEAVEFANVFDSDSEDETMEKQPPKKEGLPYWTIYIAWTLCFLMTLVSATITFFYSMMWGSDISEQWLTSMLVSFFQDAFVTQPIKVCGIALFVAAVLKTLPNDFKNASKRSETKDEEEENTDFNPENLIGFEPPDPELIEKARQYKLKENQMYGIMKENIFHAVFLFMLVIISYSDRDPMAYAQKNTLDGLLNKQIQDAKGLWSYLDNTLLPFAFDGRTSRSDPDLEGFSSDNALYIIGMPRLRQLRVKKGPCVINYTETVCENFYSAFDEEQSFYLPGWKKVANLTAKACPKPWQYHGMLDLNGIPYWGQANMYGGGGYTANLGYNTDQAKRVIADLKTNKWVDDQTRAIFIEFTVYNAHANLFSVMTLLVEMQGLGGAISLLRIETFRLYPNPGPNDSVVMFCQFAVVVITIIVAYINGKKIYHLRKEYLNNVWNIVQLVIIILTFICVGLVIVRKLDAQRTIQNVYDNPFIFISFQYTVQWSAMNTYFTALIVFLTTLRFLYLLSFNHHIIVLYKTIVKARPNLGLLAIEAFILFASLVSFSYLIFGRYTEGFGSVFLTVQTLLAMVLGKAYFVELSRTDTFLGPVFFVLFAIFMVFFLMNMFMAVLMDSYEQAKEEISPSNKEFEIADFMMQRFKAMIGVGEPLNQPWNAPRLEYIHGVDEETQRELDFNKSIEELPAKIHNICHTLDDLENINVDNDKEGFGLANTLVSQYEDGEFYMDEDDTEIIVEFLQEEEYC